MMLNPFKTTICYTCNTKETFPHNSEASASELLENCQEMCTLTVKF